ncbi:MAG: hypothetical protein CME63_10175 [Halobacteriovoraceae bacterium]|nr:hypothetical protein [Halobacteriovoraceae bacterium]
MFLGKKRLILCSIFLSTLLLTPNKGSCYAQSDDSSTSSEAEPKKIIRYNIGVKSSYSSSLTETEKNYIKKNVFEVLMQTNRFNIILGHQYKKTKRDNLFSLTIQITDAPAISGERDNDLNVKLILKDEVEDFLINFKQEKRVLRNKLQITLRSMLYGIFYGKNYDEKRDELIVNEILPLKKKEENKKPKSPKKNPEKAEDPVLEETVPEVLPEPEPKPEKEKKEPKKEEPEVKKEEKKKDKVEISDFDSPNLDLEKEIPPKPKKVELSDKWTNQFRMYVGNVDEEIISDSVVQIGTTTSRIVLGADGHMGVEGRNHFYTFGGEVGLVKGDHEFGFGPKYDFYGGYNIAPLGNFFSIGPSVSLSNLNYAAVFTEGAGEKRFSGSGLWGGVKSEIFIDFSLFTLLLDFRYQRVLVGSITSNAGDDVEASGSKVIMSATVTFWEGWGLGLRNESIEMTTLTDSNLVVRDDSFGLFLTYQ